MSAGGGGGTTKMQGEPPPKVKRAYEGLTGEASEMAIYPEPTITAATQLLEIATNQRATYRWVAAPGDDITLPAPPELPPLPDRTMPVLASAEEPAARRAARGNVIVDKPTR